MALASVSVVIVDIKDGNWNTHSKFRTQTLQKSRGHGSVIDETVSATERRSRVMTGWTAASGERHSSLDTQVSMGGKRNSADHKANTPDLGP